MNSDVMKCFNFVHQCEKNYHFRIYGNLNLSCKKSLASCSVCLHFLYRGKILDSVHKNISGHCSCLQDLAINQFASGSKQLLSTYGRNPRCKVLTLWLGQKGILSTGSVNKWGFKLWLWDRPLQSLLLNTCC